MGQDLQRVVNRTDPGNIAFGIDRECKEVVIGHRLGDPFGGIVWVVFNGPDRSRIKTD